MSISVRLEGDMAQLQNRFKTLDNLKIYTANRSIAEGLRTSTIERFRSSESPDQVKWKTSKRADETGGKTLVDTAIMRNSIQSEVSEKGIAVGTNSIKAATHQFGDEGRTIRAKRKKYLTFNINGRWRRVEKVTVNIPARPFLGISNEDMQDIKEIMEAAVSEGGL